MAGALGIGPARVADGRPAAATAGVPLVSSLRIRARARSCFPKVGKVAVFSMAAGGAQIYDEASAERLPFAAWLAKG